MIAAAKSIFPQSHLNLEIPFILRMIEMKAFV